MSSTVYKYLTKKTTGKKATNSKVVNKGGRPSKYSAELGDKICLQLLEGKSLRKICEEKDMPSKTTVCKWLATNKHEGFVDQYARARSFQADLEFDEIKEITDAEPKYIVDDKGVKKIDTGWVQLQRLRADKRQWRTSKLKPKVFGGDTAIIAGQMEDKGKAMPIFNVVLSEGQED